MRDGRQAVMRQPLAKRLRHRDLSGILNFGEAIYWSAVGDIFLDLRFLDLREISLDCNGVRQRTRHAWHTYSFKLSSF